jgi:hypothetical protein
MRTASPFAAPKPRKPPKVKRDTTDASVSRLRRLLLLIENAPGRIEYEPPEPEPISLDKIRESRQRGAEIMAWVHERYGPDGKRRKVRR